MIMIMKNISLSALQGRARLSGMLLCMLLLVSCGGSTVANTAEEDSLCIDTVATLDEVPDTVTIVDTLTVDSVN